MRNQLYQGYCLILHCHVILLFSKNFFFVIAVFKMEYVTRFIGYIWPSYPATFLDRSGPWTTALAHTIYTSPFLARIYKLWKYMYYVLTGTSELYRICHWAQYDAKRRGRAAQTPELMTRIDTYLLYSSKLILQRRFLETAPLTSSSGIPLSTKLTSVESVIAKLAVDKHVPAGSPEWNLLSPSLTTIHGVFNLINDLNLRAASKYEKDNKQHERKLLEIWECLMPTEDLKSRISSQWTKIGFQGTDPATDWRGMGCLGLDDLHYLCTVHTKLARSILAQSLTPTHWFSLAITSINVTAFTLSLLRTRQLNDQFFTLGTSKAVYHEFYVWTMNAFAEFWIARGGGVMEFQNLFSKFKFEVENKLLKGDSGNGLGMRGFVVDQKHKKRK